jgi:hypothetical protein
MDLHPPGGPVRSVKDFLVHLGIVTLGILIALGLEQVVETHQRSKIAAEALAAFRKEIADNETNVKEVMAEMTELRTKTQDAIAKLSQDAAPGGAAPRIEYPGVRLDFISSASWDSAIATHALNDLPYDTVKRYAEAFGALRIFLDAERSGIPMWQDMRRFGTNPAALTKEQRISLIEELRRYESFTYAVDLVGKGTLVSCDAALK